jgi:hypothetical protein
MRKRSHLGLPHIERQRRVDQLCKYPLLLCKPSRMQSRPKTVETVEGNYRHGIEVVGM